MDEQQQGDSRNASQGMDTGVLRASRWIPVSERLPTDDTPVLVCDEKGDMGFDVYEEGGWSCYENALEEYHSIACDEMIFGMSPVAYWMPLPPPPDSRDALQTGVKAKCP